MRPLEEDDEKDVDERAGEAGGVFDKATMDIEGGWEEDWRCVCPWNRQGVRMVSAHRCRGRGRGAMRRELTKDGLMSDRRGEKKEYRS